MSGVEERHLFVIKGVAYDAMKEYGQRLTNAGMEVTIHFHPYGGTCDGRNCETVTRSDAASVSTVD